MCAEAIRGISFSRLHRSLLDNKQALQGQIREAERMRMYFRNNFRYMATSLKLIADGKSLFGVKASSASLATSHLMEIINQQPAPIVSFDYPCTVETMKELLYV